MEDTKINTEKKEIAKETGSERNNGDTDNIKEVMEQTDCLKHDVKLSKSGTNKHIDISENVEDTLLDVFSLDTNAR